MSKLHKILREPQGKLGLVLAIAIVLSLGYYFYATSGNGGANIKAIDVTSSDHIRGTQGAKVTLVQFADFQCPACGAYEPIVRKVMEDNKGAVQLVFRHFPLTQIHQNALLAAKAAEAAGLQGKFWEMHDILFDKQAEWSKALNSKEIITGYAKALKLDMKKFESDMASQDVENKIRAEYTEGTRLGVQGTPTFFVNGKQIDNPGTVEALDAIIKEAAK